jgi:hypothetical protein
MYIGPPIFSILLCDTKGCCHMYQAFESSRDGGGGGAGKHKLDQRHVNGKDLCCAAQRARQWALRGGCGGATQHGDRNASC